jgi:hypothetical protein
MDVSGVHALLELSEACDGNRVVLSKPVGEVARVLELARAHTFLGLTIETDEARERHDPGSKIEPDDVSAFFAPHTPAGSQTVEEA